MGSTQVCKAREHYFTVNNFVKQKFFYIEKNHILENSSGTQILLKPGHQKDIYIYICIFYFINPFDVLCG